MTSILAPALFPKGLPFVLLLWRQHTQQFSLPFDPDDPHGGLERFLFLDLCFDRRHLCLVIPHERAEFPFTDPHIGLSANAGSIDIERRLAQFGHLLIGKSQLLFILEKMPEQARGTAAMAVATVMMRHHVPPASLAGPSPVGPDDRGRNQSTSQCETENNRCIACHMVLLLFIPLYRTIP